MTRRIDRRAGRRSLRKRFKYRFEERMARSAGSVFAALTIVFVGSLIVIGIVRAIVVHFVGADVERGRGPIRQMFLVFLELTDPGSMTQDVDSSARVKLFAVLAGLVGVVLFSSLIAFITAAVDRRLAELRKGKTEVFEVGHTLILGWNDRIAEILAELVIANESEPQPVVVVLAAREKEEMDDYLARYLPDTKNTRVVTRSGAESSMINHQAVALNKAKSVIILAGCNAGSSGSDKATSDMAVVKTVLAVASKLADGSSAPIVAELFNADKRELARSIDPERVICLDTDAILARIIVQTSRSTGLAVVYEEILSFAGAELYLLDTDPIVGHRFGDAVYSMRDGVPIGLCSPDGKMKINPGDDVVVEAGARFIVVASDDSSLGYREHPVPRPTPRSVGAQPDTGGLERQLVIGYNSKLPTLIAEYANYVPAGSRIDLISRQRTRVNGHSPAARPLAAVAERVDVIELEVDPMNKAELERLDLGQYASVIVLSEEHDSAPEEWIDTETLMELLQLQRIVRPMPQSRRPKLLVEILGSESRDLITSSGVREFVISNRMISMLVAQISETPELSLVYEDLFSAEGSEIYLKDAARYVPALPDRYAFKEIVAAAALRGEIAIGIRIASQIDCAELNFGVQLIPHLDSVIALEPDDAVVVVSEDDR